MTTRAGVEAYLAAPYHRIFIEEDGLIGAQVLELPGCFSSGATPRKRGRT